MYVQIYPSYSRFVLYHHVVRMFRRACCKLFHSSCKDPTPSQLAQQQRVQELFHGSSGDLLSGHKLSSSWWRCYYMAFGQTSHNTSRAPYNKHQHSFRQLYQFRCSQWTISGKSHAPNLNTLQWKKHRTNLVHKNYHICVEQRMKCRRAWWGLLSLRRHPFL